MALSMHTNYASLVTQNTLSSTNDLLTTAMERLSTGLRINSAADDAAGLAISSRLEAQVRGMTVAKRNSQDAISMMQTADGALEELTNIAYRMKDLATQSANDTNGQNERDALQAEYLELHNEMDRILNFTTYGAGETLLVGGKLASNLTFQIGASKTETLAFDMTTELGNIDTSTIGSIGTNATDSNTEIGVIDDLFNAINTARAKLGANINRLEHTINNLSSISENTSAAKGRITDADYAVETSNMTKNQMLVQAGTKVLQNTNQMPSLAMSLLG
ncbi:lateral flagellin LafA [Vibrio quintilis]|uniref:Flagellin n=1 Tax=Vibrio quintilis TaxID=1117707 RepID=A0A1M7YSU0_9VIBR|nr:lateral flagellin LafA [Vibrio quintilis]SHO55687.1 Flagellin [Vibrio quintilis]